MRAIKFAEVTSRGIIFMGMTYTCHEAIKERWYEKAAVHGAWPMIIVNDIAENKVIYLYDFQNDQWISCLLVQTGTETSDKLERYFNSLEHLKDIRRKTQINKKKI